MVTSSVLNVPYFGPNLTLKPRKSTFSEAPAHAPVENAAMNISLLHFR